MTSLISKNDVMEVVCKFKGHIVPKEDIDELKANIVPKEDIDELKASHNEEVVTTCKRCNFTIKIHTDPDDEEHYYLVSDVL